MATSTSSPATPPVATPVYAANLHATSAGSITVGQFYQSGAATLPIAICFSGGGSRAMTAALGQLQALEALQFKKQSLLSQVRAMSSVSGGSWIAVPFTFLNASTADADFLGTYMPPSQLTVSNLEDLPAQGIGNQITSGFSPGAMAVKALALYMHGTPADLLWQTIVGLHVLAPFGLYTLGQGVSAPNIFFTVDAAAVSAIRSEAFPGSPTQNSTLPQNAFVMNPSSAQQRPYLVCNTALQVNPTAGGALTYAPVQITPVMTGVVGQPPAKDLNGLAVGGGGVDSFAFSSTPQTSNATAVATEQQFQWSLMDAAGSSSAFFAHEIERRFAHWRSNPAQLAADIGVHGPEAINFLERHGALRTVSESSLSRLSAAAIQSDSTHIQAELSGLADLAPRYTYWPVADIPSAQPLQASYLEDGGSLENSGIAAMLVYDDITTIIAFVNSETKLEPGVNNSIIVDTMIPPLFGLQPYDCEAGYVPYANATNPSSPAFQNDCVFDGGASTFDHLCQGLWSASGKGAYNGIATYQQTLTTVANAWFGVAGGRQVTVLWVYLEYSTAWHDSITDDWVRLKVDALKLLENFPHYSTLHTELSATDINLLANLTAWTVQETAQAFETLIAQAASSGS